MGENEMRTVDITEAIKEIKPNMQRNIASIPDYLNAILKKVNEVAATGYRFVGIVYSPLSEDGCFLCFEKEKKYVYKIDYIDDALEMEDKSAFRKKLSKLKVHATVIFHGVIDSPLYFVAE